MYAHIRDTIAALIQGYPHAVASFINSNNPTVVARYLRTCFSHRQTVVYVARRHFFLDSTVYALIVCWPQGHWLMDWLIDWWIDWLMDWLVDWLIDWLIDWLTDWLIHWLIENKRAVLHPAARTDGPYLLQNLRAEKLVYDHYGNAAFWMHSWSCDWITICFKIF